MLRYLPAIWPLFSLLLLPHIWCCYIWLLLLSRHWRGYWCHRQPLLLPHAPPLLTLSAIIHAIADKAWHYPYGDIDISMPHCCHYCFIIRHMLLASAIACHMLLLHTIIIDAGSLICCCWLPHPIAAATPPAAVPQDAALASRLPLRLLPASPLSRIRAAGYAASRCCCRCCRHCCATSIFHTRYYFDDAADFSCHVGSELLLPTPYYCRHDVAMLQWLLHAGY